MHRGKHSNLLQSRNWSEINTLNQERTEAIGKIKERVRYAEWAKQYEELKASDLSVTEWCKENGINPPTYYHRLRKRREVFCDKYVEPIETREPFQSVKTSIVPLKLPVGKAEEITIEYGGIKMCVIGEISEEKLSVIIGVMFFAQKKRATLAASLSALKFPRSALRSLLSVTLSSVAFKSTLYDTSFSYYCQYFTCGYLPFWCGYFSVSLRLFLRARSALTPEFTIFPRLNMPE